MSDLTIYAGDDYSAEDDLQLLFTNTSGTWPVLTDATIAFEMGAIDQEGEVEVPTGDTKQVSVELTADQTSPLRAGDHPYAVRATIDERRITLAAGLITVIT